MYNLILIANEKIISKAVSKVKAAASFVCDKAKAFIIAVAALFGTSMQALAQTLAGTGYDAGTNALEEVATELVKYVPYVVNLCYALAGVVAIVGAISVYIAMNNEEQDVKKKIMMIVGACIFLIAAANALPLFFGIGG